MFQRGLEHFQYFGNIVAFRGDAIYYIPRNFQDDSYKGYISFLPLFLGAKIRTTLHETNNNYAFLSAGLDYNLPLVAKDTDWTSTNERFYNSFGLGTSIDVLVVEVVYSISRFTYLDTKSNNGSCSIITLYAIFKFE